MGYKEGHISMVKKLFEKYKENQRKIRDLFNRKEVVVAYLFGSLVKREISPLSDIDIAVYLDERIPRNRQNEVHMTLLNELITILGDDIDLILMNSADLLMNFNIIKEGEIIYQRSETEKVMIESEIMDRYMDMRYYHKRHVDVTLDRMAKEGLK